METTPCTRFGITLAGALALIGASAKADTFGGGAFPFTINFVNIGNLGNGNDVNNPVEANTPGDGGTPFGGVAYGYRMGVTEISENMIALATYHGLDGVTAGPWTGNQPARDMTWFEAAAFVNWLNFFTP